MRTQVKDDRTGGREEDGDEAMQERQPVGRSLAQIVSCVRRKFTVNYCVALSRCKRPSLPREFADYLAYFHVFSRVDS